MIWYWPTFFFSLSVRILVAPGFCLPEIQSFSQSYLRSAKIIPTLLLIDTHCSRDGVVVTLNREKLQHVYINLQLQSSKQKISGQQKPSLTVVNTSTIISLSPILGLWFNFQQKHLGAIWYFNTGRSISDVKLKPRDGFSNDCWNHGV